MVSHNVRRVAVRDLPNDLTFIQTDSRDGPIGRLDDRQALYVQSGGSTCGWWWCGRLARIGAGVFARSSSQLHRLSSGSLDVADVGDILRGRNKSEGRSTAVGGGRIHDVVFRI